MNLSAYDKINGIATKSKIYVSNNYPYIVTREIKYRKYYCFVKRYEPKIENNVLFLVLLDDTPLDRSVARTRRDNYGRLKFNMSKLKDYFSLTQGKEYYLTLTLETTADDGDIYKIELKSD